MSHTLLSKVEELKNILSDRATGGEGSDTEYVKLRRELIARRNIARLLPEFVGGCRSIDEFWGFIRSQSSTYADRREYLRQEFAPLLQMLESVPDAPSDAVISETITMMTSGHIKEIWEKALDRRATDPEGAITLSRSLLESVCKHILHEAGEPFDNTMDLPKLYFTTAERLNLSPSQHTEPLFKQILGGCKSVVEGLGAVRNKLSDAHGRGASGTRPAPRHAELAVNLSGAMATFLLQTWEARQQ